MLFLKILLISFLLWVTAALVQPGVLGHDNSRPDLTKWYESLSSQSGWCCDGSDSNKVNDADWETLNGHYRVRLSGQWVDVPDSAVIKQPNLDGRTMVWPYYSNGSPSIRCFIPGVMM